MMIPDVSKRIHCCVVAKPSTPLAFVDKSRQTMEGPQLGPVWICASSLSKGFITSHIQSVNRPFAGWEMKPPSPPFSAQGQTDVSGGLIVIKSKKNIIINECQRTLP